MRGLSQSCRQNSAYIHTGQAPNQRVGTVNASAAGRKGSAPGRVPLAQLGLRQPQSSRLPNADGSSGGGGSSASGSKKTSNGSTSARGTSFTMAQLHQALPSAQVPQSAKLAAKASAQPSPTPMVPAMNVAAMQVCRPLHHRLISIFVFEISDGS